jgi:hypothetical protein
VKTSKVIISKHILFLCAAVKPEGKAPSFISELSPGIAVEDEKYKLTVKVSGVPEPTITWFKNDKEVPLNDRVKSSFDGQVSTLSFTKLNLKDTGKYKCVVKNDFGSVTSSAEVVVKRRSRIPEVVEKMKDVNATEGDNARFEVKVSGYPSPKVQWYHRKNEIKSDGRFVITKSDTEQTYTLNIKDVNVNDAGFYKCVASNDAGDTEAQSKLVIEEKKFLPEFEGPGFKTPLVIKGNEQLSVDLKIKGKPKPEVTWFKDGNRIRESRKLKLTADKDSYNLNIPKASPEDTGTYKCEAKNEVGTSFRTFKVEVEGNINYYN